MWISTEDPRLSGSSIWRLILDAVKIWGLGVRARGDATAQPMYHMHEAACKALIVCLYEDQIKMGEMECML